MEKMSKCQSGAREHRNGGNGKISTPFPFGPIARKLIDLSFPHWYNIVHFEHQNDIYFWTP